MEQESKTAAEIQLEAAGAVLVDITTPPNRGAIGAAEFKVPKKILFMDEIPKGATGKLQRIGLAQKLGLG